LELSQSHHLVVGFEWYEFTLHAAMAGTLASKFFSGLESSLSFFFALLTFGVGFVVRPLGAVVSGRLGDLVGRKKTFLAMFPITRLATFTVGILSTYASTGVVAPVLLVIFAAKEVSQMPRTSA
jgi:MFS family permease